MITSAEDILGKLMNTVPVRLETLPAGPGIYALYDHLAHARYIGITGSLHDRIFKRHVGGDGNSHKFSSVYNAGPMFHSRKHPATCAQDGPVAKELRRLFAREHCRVVAISLPDYAKAELLSLESAVLALAPKEARSWNDSRDLDVCEPAEMLANFLTTLGWADVKLGAIERQSRRWEAHRSQSVTPSFDVRSG